MATQVIIPPFTQKHINGTKIVCPECHHAKIVDLAKYRGAKKALRAKCLCGCVFTIAMKDLRKFFRKKTNLPGSYTKTDVPDTGVMTVKDLSYAGIGFETEQDHHLEAGDILGVRLVLDDGKRTELRRMVVVRHVRGHLIGAEFCDSVGLDPNLCYYLMLS